MLLRRSLLPIAFCMMVPFATCFAQNALTFATGDFLASGGPTAKNIYTTDLHNNGVPDIIEDTASAPFGFTVTPGDGSGNFTNPVTYYFPTGTSKLVDPPPMAFGDFNGDGNVDLIVPLTYTNQVAVYLGNGDGTFQSPKISTIVLPTGYTFTYTNQIVTADFSHDGRLDVVAAASNKDATSVAFMLEGDGKGGFVNAGALFTAPAGAYVYQMAIGDFDADGNADIALSTFTPCSNGACPTVIHVLYGNGSLSDFEGTTPFSVNGALSFSTGDLNSDGRTDLFAVDGASNQLAALYGQTDRKFNSYFSPLPSGGLLSIGLPPLAMADFNGDGLMDLVGLNVDGKNTNMVFFVAASSPGQFTTKLFPLFSSTFNTNPVVGPFTSTEYGSTLPDVAFFQSSGSGPSNVGYGINATGNPKWDACPYPTMAQGIRLCISNSSTASPVTIDASANSFGQLRKIELWVDGKKVAEQNHTWEHNALFKFSSTFAAGSHTGTLYAADVDNTLQQLNFNFTAGACTAPSSVGVNVCEPVGGATVTTQPPDSTAPVQIEAAAKVTGTLARMEVWVDGYKKYSETTSASLNTSIDVYPGYHEFDIYAVNTAGTKFEKTVYATLAFAP